MIRAGKLQTPAIQSSSEHPLELSNIDRPREGSRSLSFDRIEVAIAEGLENTVVEASSCWYPMPTHAGHADRLCLFK